MKKISIISLAVFFIAISVFSIWKIKKAEAIRAGLTPYKCQTATTSPTFLLTTSASSTCTIEISRADTVDLNFMLKASTTLSEIRWNNFFTMDESEATRNWFAEKGSTLTSNTVRTVGAGPLMHSLIPADSSASSTYHSITLTGLQATYLKVEYSVKGANGAVYLEVVKHNE